MKVTVFTSNQLRHLHLLRRLAADGHEVNAIIEASTITPGEASGIFNVSNTMATYFRHVRDAERHVFGDDHWLRPGGVRSLLVTSMGDVTRLPIQSLEGVMDADAIVVFGASYIREPVCSELERRRAVNIHMGYSPYYRGNSCNFWALADGRPEDVGATIHRLSIKLDAGDILFHVFPAPGDYAPFELGMRSVEAAHRAVSQALKQGGFDRFTPVSQDRSLERRYTRRTDFTDDVVVGFLASLPSPPSIRARLEARDLSLAVAPRVL